ncbi:peptidoglycan DD-metalloendopeptidase family protein [Roseivirga misakiensis]|uniref:Peptidase M23 n=1 Tax=Roseivirga misakiensis TaxID=1563681 RepID=A0A1E5SYN5_9BACT|nr:peptidoglycan DD-metalloendopeptidase family protein [Roseivirga misakiensis]OEK04225.1 peptidase M23 [Roseivirga misakiensis]
MKNFIITLLLLFSAISTVSAQKESDNLKAAAKKFVEAFNADKPEVIFNMFSDVMKKAAPEKTLNPFLASLKSELGPIQKNEFVKYENGGVALYKMTFAKGIRGFNLAVDAAQKIIGLRVIPFEENTTPVIERNTTSMILPFKEEWTVFWGGTTTEQNYHVTTPSQQGAFDLLITDDQGKSYQTNGQTNEDFYVFGKEIIAPAAGEVVLVVDGIKDNKPGDMNPIYVPGNTVIIKTANNEYLFFAHFKQHSIVVNQGQKVAQGEVLGLTGNSGNSSEPHLHFHIQNEEEMSKAIGARAFFAEILVNGELKKDYSPVRGEKIRNK